VEAATRAALLRNELAQSKKEQAEYLRQVDRAKNYEKAQDKKRVRQERRGEDTTGNGDGHGHGHGGSEKAAKKPKKERDFEQRSVVHAAKGAGVDAKLGSVLDSLF
jgi:ESF2/ABP1 family protein